MLGDDCCHDFMIYLSILITEIQYNKIVLLFYHWQQTVKEISNENELEQMEYGSVLILQNTMRTENLLKTILLDWCKLKSIVQRSPHSRDWTDNFSVLDR